MTQFVTIDRATLDQIVVALKGVESLIEHQYTGTREGMNALQNASDDAQVAITEGRAALANAEPAGWQPIETAPKGGKFLIAVWEGDWDNPKQNCTLYQATGFLSGPVWAMRGNYRTEEGGAYKLAGWMPLPAAPKDTL